MTISRRTVLAGVGTAAIAPALPALARSVVCQTEHQGVLYSVLAHAPQTVVAEYGVGPMITATEIIQRQNALRLPDFFRPEDFDGILQLIADEEDDAAL